MENGEYDTPHVLEVPLPDCNIPGCMEKVAKQTTWVSPNGSVLVRYWCMVHAPLDSSPIDWSNVWKNP